MWNRSTSVRTVLMLGLITMLTSVSTPLIGQDANSKKEDVPGEGKRAKEFIAAFNAGDAKAIARFYTQDAEYVDQMGHRVKGRPAIQKLYDQQFAEQKGAKLTITMNSARMVTPDVALEDGLAEVTPAEGGPPTVAHFTAVLVKKDGAWYFESVHDAVAHPPSNAERFAGLDWLLGDWVGEDMKGESLTSSYNWAENRNFIVCTFATTHNGVPVVGGTQWIAWDAGNKQIRSWSFYSGGGIGESQWTQDGNTWKIKATATTAAGKKVSVTNLVTKIDGDHFTLQPTKMSVDGTAIPDSAPVKMKRMK
jgi:uncharacterized protein (TIGR02246 family)